ncbi:MAG: isoprenylcysteine carboxylmethyltransferase family protein [Bacteroidales bacterium]|nr:isoprenylcysteine carboxylmethyltransferase family protein [Bacteroidales bacterium]
MCIHDIIALDLRWCNAWIPIVFMMVAQIICMKVYGEGGRRAVDTSWYDTKAKQYALLNSIFQFLMIIVAVFVPLRFGTAWFIVGASIYAAAFLLFIWSFWSYGTADRNRLITKGIYRYSRNPMYAVFTLAIIGVIIASTSLWLLIVLIPYVWTMHKVVLSEEEYCEKTYGNDYIEYKQHVPRYFLFI